MPRSRDYVPSHCVHKASGRGYVWLGGRMHYTGRAGSAEAQAEYDRLIAGWLERGRRPEPPRAEATASATVGDVARWYREAAGRGEVREPRLKLKTVLADLEAAAGRMAAEAFGPKAFKALRSVWVGRDLCRRTVNQYAALVKRAFQWAVEEELVPGETYQALRSVRGVRKGMPGVRESRKVEPVPEADLDAVIALLDEPLASMARLQRWTGMRPGEVCRMRASEVDRSGEVWVYEPGRFKTDHHEDAVRRVFLGPRAMEVLAPWLDRAARPSAYVFPARWRPGKSYTGSGYWKAIAVACDRAGVPRFHPNRIRHTRATEVRRHYGLEAAGAVLGHDELKTTAIYAERDQNLAAEIAKASG